MPMSPTGGYNVGRSLLALQHVNSETGNRQPIAQARALTRERDALFLVDCSQSAGKFALPDCDMAIVAGPPVTGLMLGITCRIRMARCYTGTIGMHRYRPIICQFPRHR